MLQPRRHGAPLEVRLTCALLAALSILLVVEAGLALRWRMIHDTPMLHYVAWSISELGYAPYRDIFETSFPGSLMFHIAIGRSVGWGDFGFQVVNLLWLLSVSAVTYTAIARVDRRAAWAAVVLYGLQWYGNGPWMLLQRDGVAVLPIAAAVSLATSPLATRRWAAFLIGVGFGAAVTIKPHLAIGFPLAVLYPWAAWGGAARRAWDEAVRAIVWGSLGLMVPILTALAWVWSFGALDAFVEMIVDYLPLHVSLSGQHETLSAGQRVSSVFLGIRDLGGHAVWLAPLFVAFLRSVEPGLGRPARTQIGLWVALAVAYTIEPAFAGQFWDYHWMPFQYFAAVAGGLLLVRPKVSPEAPESHRIAPVALLAALVFFGVNLAPNFRSELMGGPPLSPKEGRVDAIASWLAAHEQPGDECQSLDWSGGAVHAMLLARIPSATRYPYDYVFYHHVDDPVVARMRLELVGRLFSNPPRFLIRFDGERVTGPAATDEFDALEVALDERYAPALVGDDYTIYERRPDASRGAQSGAPGRRARGQ